MFGIYEGVYGRILKKDCMVRYIKKEVYGSVLKMECVFVVGYTERSVQ